MDRMFTAGLKKLLSGTDQINTAAGWRDTALAIAQQFAERLKNQLAGAAGLFKGAVGANCSLQVSGRLSFG